MKFFTRNTVAFPALSDAAVSRNHPRSESLMKTDDYKQELRLSATLCQTNTKKYFWALKKIDEPPEKLCEVSVVLREMTKSVSSTELHLEKWPLD
jgi:hypothetical protein